VEDNHETEKGGENMVAEPNPHVNTPLEKHNHLEAALDYADRGIPIFPCQPGGKAPLVKGGFHAATTDHEQIKEWWTRYPDANIGTPRFHVLDCDQGGHRTLNKLAKRPLITRRVRTPRGGFHVHFEPNGYDFPNTTKLEGIDTRKAGKAYVLLPPSSTEDGAYEWLTDSNRTPAYPPEDLLNALGEATESHSEDSETSTGGVVSIERGGPEIPDGQRNKTLVSIAGRLHDGTRTLPQLKEELEAINQARCEPPLGSKEREENNVPKIASNTYQKEPCTPGGGRPGPETLGAVDAFAEHVCNAHLPGNGGLSDYKILTALVELALKHGSLLPGGIRVEASFRQLAEEAKVARKTVERRIPKLRQAGWLTQDLSAGKDGESSAFVLRLKSDDTQPKSRETVGWVSSCVRLRSTRPVMEKGERVDTIYRLGPGANRIVDTLERAGGSMPVCELARRLGCQPSDLIRRSGDGRLRGRLTRLLHVDVMRWYSDVGTGRTMVSLTDAWLDRIEEERQRGEELADDERQKNLHAQERRNYRVRLMYYRDGIHPDQISRELDMEISKVRVVLQKPPAGKEAPPLHGDTAQGEEAVGHTAPNEERVQDSQRVCTYVISEMELHALAKKARWDFMLSLSKADFFARTRKRGARHAARQSNDQVA